MQTKTLSFQFFILIALLFALACASGACSSSAGDAIVKPAKAAEEKVPVDAADAEINSVLKIIEKTPDSPDGYSQLAAVYIKKARATGDFSLNSKAETAVKRALEIEPQNLSAKKLRCR